MTPSPRLVLLVALAVLPAAAALATPDAIPIAGALDAALALALAVALLRRVPPGAVHVVRHIAPVQFVRGEAEVTLSLENRVTRGLSVAVRDLLPPEVEALDPPVERWVPAGARVEARYRVRFPRRGRHSFGDIHVRVRDRLGLLQFDSRIEAPAEVRVYPAPLASGGGPLALTRLAQEAYGSGRARITSEGCELDGLRRFVTGDDPRLIDWKASARRGVPILREMRPERNQRLVLMVDLGRALHPSLGEGTKLDRVLEAVHDLAVLALESGDEVGLVAFGADVRALVPPRRGGAHGRRLLETLLDLASEPVEPAYPEAFAAVGRLVSRRALVALFTDVIDPVSSRTVVEGLTRLRPRHLPLCVTVEDSALRRVAVEPSATVDSVYRKVAARELLADQSRALHGLAVRGVLTIHVPASDLAAATVNRYLEVKYRGLL